ncbi:exonuclease [Shimia sp. R9_2]|uniref:exonuclease domain-containing protein n=1 Tax=Shimia sp. R9_2 TaxID=2821112 RepID=UPI001ADD1674|nr:exonuclease domain-containing protein [Shimia sp. R9_2]MBO9395105.1 exonuclease [Shimia sp. R9_2]
MTAFLPDQPMLEGLFRFIALDVETANAHRHSISQIGLAGVCMDGMIETFATYIDPEEPFAPFNTELTGISAATVRGAPTFAQAWPLMAPVLSRHLLVQHSGFDEKAITAASLTADLGKPKLHWADSVKIARKAWPEFRGNGGHGLGHLKEALGLEFHHHDAGEDARAAAQVVLQAEQRLGKTIEQITGKTAHLQLSFAF